MWSASARKAYDEMEARALKAESKLAKVRSSLDTGLDTKITPHDTLSWNTVMIRAVNDMLREASSTLDPTKIFEVVTRRICEYLDGSSAYVFDWNPIQKTTTVLADHIAKKATEDEYYSDVGVVYQLDEEFEKRLTTGEDYWVSHHDETSLAYVETLEYKRYGVKTSIYAPMHIGGQLTGFLEVWDTSVEREFTKNQTEFIVYIANQIAGSVRMAQLHRAMVESEQRYRTLMRTIGNGVAQVDMNGNIQFVNQHFATMLGMPIENILYQNLETLWQQEAKATEVEGEYYLNSEDRDEIWVQVTHAPIPGESVNFIGEAVVYSDITRRKEAEQLQIRIALENERINLLANFIKDTSHEFYTPLSVVNTRLFMLRKQYPDEELLKGLNVIEAQADIITGLIKALVEMTKLDAIDALPQENYNISLLVEQIVTKYQPTAASSHKILDFETDDSTIIVAVDPERLSMAISEIMKNALNYTAEYGMITVRVHEWDDKVQIIIKDTGIGISQDTQKRVFERFYRADEARSTRGFGLGLSIAKRVIDLHKGDITIESEAGADTSFIITLPKFRIKALH